MRGLEIRAFKMRKIARYLSFQPFLGYNEKERAAFFCFGPIPRRVLCRANVLFVIKRVAVGFFVNPPQGVGKLQTCIVLDYA